MIKATNMTKGIEIRGAAGNKFTIQGNFGGLCNNQITEVKVSFGSILKFFRAWKKRENPIKVGRLTIKRLKPYKRNIVGIYFPISKQKPYDLICIPFDRLINELMGRLAYSLKYLS